MTDLWSTLQDHLKDLGFLSGFFILGCLGTLSDTSRERVAATYYLAYAVMAVSLYTGLASDKGLTLVEGLLLLGGYGVLLYAALSAAFQGGVGKYLTRTRGEKWVKELDYVYITIGAIGVVAALNRLDRASDRFQGADFVAPLVVVTALTIRLLKTRAEVAGWNKIDFYDKAKRTA
jgi:hypothetical protein